MLSNLNRREIIILSVAIIIIILTLYYVYVYDPLVKDITQLQDEKANKVSEVEVAQNMVSRLPELRERYQNLTERADFINFFNISNDQLLVELKQIADNNNITLRSFRPNASEDTIDIAMFIEADYFDLNNFLTELKRFEYWMDYKTMTVRPTDENLQVNLSLTFHKKGLIGGENNE
jgi:Tfp pilus assembly protein PilO